MLENVQIRATKLVDGFGNLEYPERLRRLNLPTLVYRRQRGDMIELYKHFTKYDKETISSSFRPKTRTSARLNHNLQLHELRAKDGVRGVHHKSFYQRSTKMWNALDTTVVTSDECRKNGNKKSKLAPKQHEIERIRDMIGKNFENQEINFQKSFFGGVLIN